ncbi:hypothetical protein K2X92_03700 [Candidatus Gracilibacteria bacterium]|nr:hypothetical protein [Candidatus Gracilibacteria bacterium]
MKIFKSLFYLVFLTISNICLTFAAVDPSRIRSPGDILPASPANDIGDGIGSMIAWMIGLSAVLTIMAVTWAGIKMVLAVGEEEKMKKARQTMIYAFVGLIISGLAYGAVTFVTKLQLNTFL